MMSSGNNHTRRVGAAADLSEIEYISSLHQTDLPDLRADGTISSTDIALFLRSKYGIVINTEEAKEIVLGLSGRSEENKKDDSTKKLQRHHLNNNNNDNECAENSSKDEQEEVQKQSSFHKGIKQKISKTNDNPRNIDSRATSSVDVIIPENVDAHKVKSSTSLLQKPKISKRRMLRSIDPMLTENASRIKQILRNSTSSQDEKEDNEEYLDLVEIVSLLLIPTLIRLAKDVISDNDTTNFSDDNTSKTDCQRQNTPVHENHTEEKEKDSSSFNQSYVILRDILEVIMTPFVQSVERYDSMGSSSVIINGEENTSESTVRLPMKESNVQALTNNNLRNLLEHYRLVAPDNCSSNSDDCNDITQCMIDALTSSYCETTKCKKVSNTEYEPHSHHNLDVVSFARALTNDVNLNDGMIEYLDMNSAPLRTTESDVFGIELAGANRWWGHEDPTANISRQENRSSTTTNDDQIVNDIEHEEASPSKTKNDPSVSTTTVLPRHKTLKPHIDYIADTLRSTAYASVIWLFFIFVFLYYMSIVGVALPNFSDNCTVGIFWCELGTAVVIWLIIAITLSICGLLVMAPLSRPNNPFVSSHIDVICSIVVTILAAIVPMAILYVYDSGIPHSNDGTLNEIEQYLSSTGTTQMFYMVFIFACILVICQICIFVKVSLLDRYMINKQHVPLVLTPSHTIWTVQRKVASAKKINDLLQNALKLHKTIYNVGGNTKESPSLGQTQQPMNNSSSVGSSFAHYHNSTKELTNDPMLNYILYGEEYETFGGLKYIWCRIWDQRLFCTDGFNIPSRLWVGQLAQVLSLVAYVLFMTVGMNYAIDSSETKRRDIDSYIAESIQKDSLLSYIPEEWMIRRAWITGICIGFIEGICLILLYIPSTIEVIAQLRCGIIPTFHDNKNFRKYRKCTESVYQNLSNMIYAMLGSMCLFWFFFGLLIFVFLWPPTAEWASILLAWFVGLEITVLLRMVVIRIFRKKSFQAFYRTQPNWANLFNVAMESWKLGVGTGTLMSRLGQFLLGAAFWIGRIDVPFVSSDVTLFGYKFDKVPLYYRTFLLSYEAHNHPYMERLGLIYMMKIRYKNNFCSSAGSYWRILLVAALMPWLMKYKIYYLNSSSSEEDESDDEDNKHNSSKVHKSFNTIRQIHKKLGLPLLMQGIPKKLEKREEKQQKAPLKDTILTNERKQ